MQNRRNLIFKIAVALIGGLIANVHPLLANPITNQCELTEILSKPEKISAELMGFTLRVRLEKDRPGRSGDSILIENSAEEPFVTCELTLPSWFYKAYFSTRTQKIILLQGDTDYSVLGTVSLKECAYIEGPSLYGTVSLRNKSLFEKYPCGADTKENCGVDIPVNLDSNCKILSQTN